MVHCRPRPPVVGPAAGQQRVARPPAACQPPEVGLQAVVAEMELPPVVAEEVPVLLRTQPLPTTRAVGLARSERAGP